MCLSNLILTIVILCVHLHCILPVNCLIGDFSTTGSRTNINIAEDDLILLEPINGTRDFRINSKKDQDDKPWFDGRDLRFIHCVRPAKCEKLQNNTCFGSKLPYAFTSLDLTDSRTQAESQEKLYMYEALRNIPKCWAVIQPFLCAVFAPKCEKIKGREMVYLPSLEMCRITSEPCRILYNTSFFPEFLKCSESFFPTKCNNDVREMKFNAVGQCLPPLVQAELSTSYYKDIEGCGLQCKDPLYTDDEHEGVHMLIAYNALICFLFHLFVIATYFIHDWKKSKHPAWIVFYMNLCLLIHLIGWSMQFIPGNRESIVCRKDGTLRHSEPSAGENLSCIIPFVLIYYFLMAAMVWFTIFQYAWYLQTTDRGSVRDRIDKKNSYFHLIAWSLPLVLTITIMALSEVDGNSIIGICFVGYRNHYTRIGLVLFPFAVLSIISIFFFIRGLLQLSIIRKSTIVTNQSRKLHSIFLRMLIRTILPLLFIAGSFVFQVYEFRNSNTWSQSLNELIICKIKSTHTDIPSNCKLGSRPSVAILQLRLLCLFGVCLVISSWCWTPSTFKTWSRFIRKKMGQEISDDEKFTKPKHKVIADAYAKRLEGVISISIQNSHTDPAELNFDMNNLNSTESNGMGTTLTNYLCNIINRRNAVTHIDFRETNNCPPCTNSCASSCDSEISVSVRQFNLSVESRRSSVDSQVSYKLSETEIKATVESRSQKHKSLKMKTKKRQRYASGRGTNRRASSSSIESKIVATALQKIKCNGNSRRRRIERRSACTEFNINDIKLLGQSALIPNHTSLTTSEDEEFLKKSPHIQNAIPDLHFNKHSINKLDESINSLGFISKSSAFLPNNTGLEKKIHPLIHNLLLKNGPTRTLDNSCKNHCEYEYNNSHLAIRSSENNSLKNNKNKPFRSSSHSNNNNCNNINSNNINNKSHEADVITTSLSSSFDLGIPLAATQSSYSGVSNNGIKTHSRNSKGSCDVAVQANAYDIASQADLNTLNYTNEEDMETHQLLPFKKREQSIVSRKNTTGVELSESEKVRMLLLPDANNCF